MVDGALPGVLHRLAWADRLPEKKSSRAWTLLRMTHATERYAYASNIFIVMDRDDRGFGAALSSQEPFLLRDCPPKTWTAYLDPRSCVV